MRVLRPHQHTLQSTCLEVAMAGDACVETQQSSRLTSLVCVAGASQSISKGGLCQLQEALAPRLWTNGDTTLVTQFAHAI